MAPSNPYGIDIDDTAPAPKPAPVAPSPPPATDIHAGELDPEARARTEADDALAKANGFALKPPIYAFGSRVNSAGVANARASRAAHEERPFMADLAATFGHEIAAERRRDYNVKVGDLKMLDDGRLQGANGGAIPMTEEALAGLITRTVPYSGAGAYLHDVPPDVRAWNVNRALALDPKREVKLRCRTKSGGPQVFAAVGPRYAAHDVDEITRAFGSALPTDARGDVAYDGRRAKIEASFHSDLAATKYAAGEIFRASVIATSADDGFESVRIRAAVTRNLCLNLIILDTATQDVFRRTHRGNGIAEAIRGGLALAYGRIDTFADAWRAAERDRVIDESLGEKGARAAFEALVSRKLVAIPGYGRDGAALVDGLMGAWNVEPGYNRSAVINAVTRFAQTVESPWLQESVEEQGGALLYAKRLDLSAVGQ